MTLRSRDVCVLQARLTTLQKVYIHQMYKCEFADDVALLATTCTAADAVISVYSSEARKFGLMVSTPKTKFLVVGHGMQEEESLPMSINGGTIECVKEFPFLGSLIAASGRIDAEVDKCLANASKAFGALRQAVFTDANLISITTMRHVYQACILSVLQLMYGGECWIPLRKYLKRLNAFHHHCIRSAGNQRQWEERTTSGWTRE